MNSLQTLLSSATCWVFDLDGTLTDSFPGFMAALRGVLSDRGVAIRDDEVREILGLSAKIVLARKLSEEQRSDALFDLTLRLAKPESRPQVFPKIKCLLDELKAKGVRLALWTSRDRVSLGLLLVETGLDAYFEVTVSGCCVTAHKPHLEGIQLIAKQLNVAAEQMVMVGDHDVDVKAGRRFGATSIRADWHGFYHTDQCEDAHFIVRDIDQLIEALSS
jgi:HAD superfamily hydrolase (TIGR01509 family)